MPSVFPEWKETAEEHVDLHAWDAVLAQDMPTDGSFVFNSERRAIVCVSFQDLDDNLGADADETKARLRPLEGAPWDMIIFDEAHLGDTERSQRILDRLEAGSRNARRLFLSGTPFERLASSGLRHDQVYSYSYLDEDERRCDEIKKDPSGNAPFVYRCLPSLVMSAIDLSATNFTAHDSSGLYDTGGDFSLNRLFDYEKSKFTNDQALSGFLDSLCRDDHKSATPISIYGQMGRKLGLKDRKPHHVWWMPPNQAMMEALKYRLSQHPYFRNFRVIVATGRTKKRGEAYDVDDLRCQIQMAEEDTNCQGSITLTCRRFLTGSTVPQWSAILVLNDGDKPESYYQAIFRVQSSWMNDAKTTVLKSKAWIFDFLPGRCLRLVHDYTTSLHDVEDALNITGVSGTKKDDLAKRVISSFALNQYLNGDLEATPASAHDLFVAAASLSAYTALANKISSDNVLQLDAFGTGLDEALLDGILNRIRGHRSARLDAGVMIEIGKRARQERSHNARPDETPPPDPLSDKDKKKQKEQVNEARKKMRKLSIAMTDFIYLTKEREAHIRDVIESLDRDLFEATTGITVDDFKWLQDVGILNVEHLNRVVLEFRAREEPSLSPAEFMAALVDAGAQRALIHT
jgi:hypothetical protein